MKSCGVRQNADMGFVPRRGTIDAIFIKRQIMEKHEMVRKKLLWSLWISKRLLIVSQGM